MEGTGGLLDPNKAFNSITNPALQTAAYKKRGTGVFLMGRKSNFLMDRTPE